MNDPHASATTGANSSPSGDLWMDAREWRDPDGFAEHFQREFPAGASEWDQRLSRRRFLQLAGASVAFATLPGCRLPQEKIVPYIDQPEKIIPGKPLHFATTLQINGHPRGVVVTSHEGRPTHIAGNALHPLSLGANDIWTGAAILELYDPDRLQTIRDKKAPTNWDAFTQAATAISADWTKTGGAGACLLTGAINSPTMLGQLSQLLAKYPQARWYAHEPLESSGPVDVLPDLADADVIFALESDFLFDRPDSLALTRAFCRRRQVETVGQCNRLYVAESCPTITGAKADHRFRVPPQDFGELVGALAKSLSAGHSSAQDPRWPWLDALVEDLRAHAGRSLIFGGRSLPMEVQIAVAAANAALGNQRTNSPAAPAGGVSEPAPLAHMIGRMRAAEVTSLVILGGNPVYDAPSDFQFGDLLELVPTTIHHSLYANETSASCNWVINAAHDLEAWGDARASDGTRSICQPLIAPLYDGKSALEVISVLVEAPGRSGYDLVRETWKAGIKPTLAVAESTSTTPSAPNPAGAAQGIADVPDDFDKQWRRWLRDGVIPPTSSAPGPDATPRTSQPEPDSAETFAPAPTLRSAGPTTWLSFRASSAVWDGRHANSGWLQELADPITKLTWDNAAYFSPALANELGAQDGDIVKITAHGVSLEAPVLIVPGHCDGAITLPLGYGRSRAGSVGNQVGFNAYLLRRSDGLWQMPCDDVEKTGKTHPLARTQEHFRVEGRDLLHVSRLDAPPTVKIPTLPEPPVPSLYPKYDYSQGHAWAMTINLNTCIGCNACILACQSENNIPVVGKEQVLFGREMQWIRVDRYYQGPEENPRAHFQPVPCMHCENAPCEVVCPVAATQHDDEGLNVMVYNRCVGTRYCSNNCPYKVRRFNFLFYNEGIPESRALQLNPNVTVRSRGVMEKCTYCVQRIEEARIGARREHRPLRGSDVVTACQAACPAEAIIFGDMNEPEGAVAKSRRLPGNYAMLADLDTRPRTTYLEKKINPNPALEPRPTTDSAPAHGI